MVYKRAIVSVGQSGLVGERLAAERPWMPLLDDVPETMWPLLNICCFLSQFFMRVYSFFSSTFYFVSIQPFNKVKRYCLIFIFLIFCLTVIIIIIYFTFFIVILLQLSQLFPLYPPQPIPLPASTINFDTVVHVCGSF